MRALITGGVGFIGTNLSNRLLSDGHEVVLFDNLSRVGVHRNLDWLRAKHGETLKFVLGDVRDFDAVLSNNMGFGDQNVSVLIRRPPRPEAG